MVCVYCNSKTKVTNSRPQKRTGTTWRRRECLKCRAIFTSIEQADLSGSVLVATNTGDLTPFSRDKLFLSIVKALGHRVDAASDASALIATIVADLQTHIDQATLKATQIRTTTLLTLRRFDVAAGVQYAAYHR